MPTVATDPWADYMPTPGSPGRGAVDVTPSDVNELTVVAKYLSVEDAGDVAVVFADGSTHTYTCPAGFYIWGQIRQVKMTGTTATKIKAYIK
jgi:hypothetical protein